MVRPSLNASCAKCFADLAAITFDNLIERQEYWVGHVRLPRYPDTSGTKANVILRGRVLAQLAQLEVCFCNFARRAASQIKHLDSA